MALESLILRNAAKYLSDSRFNSTAKYHLYMPDTAKFMHGCLPKRLNRLREHNIVMMAKHHFKHLILLLGFETS
jgi:hypothetical protein